MQHPSIPGYAAEDRSLPPAPLSRVQFAELAEAALFGDDDVAALRRSLPLVEPRTDEILDVWYGFVGSKPFLLEQFSNPATREPIGDYLTRVRARFGAWITDTARAQYDDAWLRWQFEIGRRHHRVGKNRTDGATSTALVPFRYLLPLAQPIVATLRPFLAAEGLAPDEVDAMQDAWRKSVLLQLTLWSHPYVRDGDY